MLFDWRTYVAVLSSLDATMWRWIVDGRVIAADDWHRGEYRYVQCT